MELVEGEPEARHNVNDPVKTGSGGRLMLIDVIRGVAILAMVVYHFSWDLSYFRLIDVDVTVNTGWVVFARAIAATFVGLVGVNLTLSTRKGVRWGSFLRRLGLIIAAATLVSIGTYWLDPRSFVFFGILHCIAVASVLALAFLRLPSWLVLLSAGVSFVAPQIVRSPVFDGYGWYWLGLSADPPASVDFVPILPWFGVVLIGMVTGRLIVAHREGRDLDLAGAGLVGARSCPDRPVEPANLSDPSAGADRGPVPSGASVCAG